MVDQDSENDISTGYDEGIDVEDTRDTNISIPPGGGSEITAEDTGVVDSSSIIIIHPGSRYLRIGRASDTSPKKILHAVARKRTKAAMKDPTLQRRDDFVVPQIKMDQVRHRKIIDTCRKMSHMLQNSLRSDGRKRFVESAKSVAQTNAGKLVHKAKIRENQPRIQCFEQSIYGKDILKLSSNEDEMYNIHFPFHRGSAFVNKKVGGSVTGIMADLEDIWLNALEVEMNIQKEELGRFKAVCIIPAIYNRSFVKNYLTVLLSKLGFSHAFVIQDHVAATFGAGLSQACVVDVGDQKISVSCVEDGISHPQSRIQLNIGGSDITQIFFFMLRQNNFPYKECDPCKNTTDAEMLQKLKEENCHMNLDICGTAEKSFSVPRNGYNLKFSVCLSDECLMAPLSLFNVDLLELTREETSRKRVNYMSRNEGDPEDPHDNIYLEATSRKYTKAGDNILTGQENEAANTQVDPDEIGISVTNDNSNSNMDRLFGTSLSDPLNAPSQSQTEQLLTLDTAILRSIESCSTEESRRKMFGAILLVGGGIKFRGVAQYIKHKLTLQIPSLYRTDLSDILIDPKDTSSEITSWKGAAIMAGLDTAQEFWITSKEWSKYGQKVLREKSPFPWS